MKLTISLHDAKIMASRISCAIADLEIDDNSGALEGLRALEKWLHGKIELVDDRYWWEKVFNRERI